MFLEGKLGITSHQRASCMSRSRYLAGDTHIEERRWQTMDFLIIGSVVMCVMLVVVHNALIELDTDSE